MLEHVVVHLHDLHLPVPVPSIDRMIEEKIFIFCRGHAVTTYFLRRDMDNINQYSYPCCTFFHTKIYMKTNRSN